MMLVSVQDVHDRLRYELDDPQVEQAIRFASTEVAAVCPKVSFEFVEDDTVVLYGTAGQLLALPGQPVAEVHSVAVNGTDVSGWELRNGRLWLSRGWGSPSDAITVTYDHGFDEPPQAAKSVALARAVRLLTNPEQVMQKRRGDYSVSYGSSTTEVTGLTRWEMRFLTLSGLRDDAEVW